MDCTVGGMTRRERGMNCILGSVGSMTRRERVVNGRIDCASWRERSVNCSI